MLNVGLTGGIGTGKTTVSNLFKKRGAHIIDFDILSRKVVVPGKPAWQSIIDIFGTGILLDDMTLDREALGNIVFGDRENLNALNGIVHPAVFREWGKDVERISARDGEAIIICDVPLLFEAGLPSHFDSVVLVYASHETQIRRVMRRNGLSRKKAEDRLALQIPIDEKISKADFVIYNNGPVAETERYVDEIWRKLVIRERKLREEDSSDDREKRPD